MAYSNLQSFHRGLALQNATALPAEYYADLHNASSVRTVSRYLAAPIACIHEAIPTVTDKIQDRQPNLTLQPLSEKQIFPSIAPQRIPTVSTVLRPVVTIDNQPVLEKDGKVIWKPGHGLIEKVDKLTGEIVHLAEDYPNSSKA